MTLITGRGFEQAIVDIENKHYDTRYDQDVEEELSNILAKELANSIDMEIMSSIKDMIFQTRLEEDILKVDVTYQPRTSISTLDLGISILPPNGIIGGINNPLY